MPHLCPDCSASLLFLTRSASTYTCPPISRNLADMCAMPAWAWEGVRLVGADSGFDLGGFLGELHAGFVEHGGVAAHVLGDLLHCHAGACPRHPAVSLLRRLW